MNKNSVEICLLTIFFFITSCSMKRDIYFIPLNFEGCVLIVYEVENSTKCNFDEFGNRIFRIPKNGILETEASVKYGISLPDKFYIEDTLKNFKELKYISQIKKRRIITIMILLYLLWNMEYAISHFYLLSSAKIVTIKFVQIDI